MAQTINQLTTTYHPLYSSMLGGAGGNVLLVNNSGGLWRVVDETGATVRDHTAGPGFDFNSVRISPDGLYVYGRNGSDIVRLLISDASYSTLKTLGSTVDAFGGGEGDFDEAGNRLPYIRATDILGYYDISGNTISELDISSHTATDAAAMSASGLHMQIIDDNDGHILIKDTAGTLSEVSGSMAPVVGHNTTSAKWPDGTDCMVTTTIAWPVDGVTNYNSGSANPPLHYVVATNMHEPIATDWDTDYTILLAPNDIGWGDSVVIHGRGTDVIVSVYNDGAAGFRVFRCHTDGRPAVLLVDEVDPGWPDYWLSGFASLNAERKKVFFSYDQGSGIGTYWVNVGLVDGTYSLR